MKLKTLKDLDWMTYGNSGKLVKIKELKQLAIKWIKEIDMLLLKEKKQKVIFGLLATRQWITQFFNITEEDLNENK